MWIKHPNGQVVLVLHEAHITRLLSEGGQEVADPRVPLAPKAQPEKPRKEAKPRQPAKSRQHLRRVK